MGLLVRSSFLLLFVFSGCAHAPFTSGSTDGVASWYGKEFQGRKTASGEIFNMHALTAAHRTLPFGTRVRVRRLDNGLSVIVRVNDRGPYSGNRILDISYAAAKKLAMLDVGAAQVQLTVLSSDSGTD